MNTNLFRPYPSKIIKIYFGLIFFVIIVQSYIFFNFSQINFARPALLQLGRVMGGAFAFIFSIGIYLAQSSANIRPRLMPLFPNYILYYIILFTFSSVFPFIIYSSNLTDTFFKIYSIICLNFSFLCLVLIPLVYEKINTRFNPRDVLAFLKDTAINNMENSQDYSESWQHTVDITRICNIIYEDDVDLFSGGITHLCSILNKGIIEYEERPHIILNGNEIPLEEWIRLLQTRIIWIGEKVVDNRLAFERIIIQVGRHIMLPEVIFSINYYLCNDALRKEEIDSLEIGLRYFIPWCRNNNLYDECTSLENGLFNLRN